MAWGDGTGRPGVSRRSLLGGAAAGLVAAGVQTQSARAQVATQGFTAAAIVFDPAWGDLDGNIARMAEGIEAVGQQGACLAVLPETATVGYIFDDFAMVQPFLDTVPGKTTAAFEKVTRALRMYVSVGIAELDQESGLGYNTAALIGPDGYIGKYRKHGLNSQDQRWTSPGNLGFPVFDTELGRLSLLICYDDTYWQYARLALLHDVDIICWSSVSDRVMPGTPPAQAKGDHSTVANLQYVSFHSGAYVVAATRNGIEENPLTKQKLYYNGGSSIWDPNGHKLAQAAVVPPEVLASGVHGVITAEVEPAKSAPVRAGLMARRRPELYHLLALHRSPTDVDASASVHHVTMSIQGADYTRPPPSRWRAPPKGGLTVLPALFRYGPDRPDADYRKLAEPRGAASEVTLLELARSAGGYAAGSYPEADGQRVYHTVVLAGPSGIIARYRATHLMPDQDWATPGDQFVVVPTPLGRIGLVLGEELSVPEVFGVYSAQRADLIVAPAGRWRGPLLEVDPKLFNVAYPRGTPYAPFGAAQLGQFWSAAAGWAAPKQPAALLLGPEPVIATPTRVAAPGESLQATLDVPWAGTWINQQQLIDAQQPWNTVPLVLPQDSACFQSWRRAAGWQKACW